MSNNDLFEFSKYIKMGIIKPNDIISKIENDVKSGKSEPQMLTFVIKYLALIQKLNNMPDDQKYIDLNELVNLGLYDSIDDVLQTLEEHKDEVKIFVKTQKFAEYPEPYPSEIKQNIESSNPEKTCIICTHRKRHTFCIPCGHSIFCTICAKQYILNSDNDTDIKIAKCPICRLPINKINRIYT
jgi:hypothetical protein